MRRAELRFAAVIVVTLGSAVGMLPTFGNAAPQAATPSLDCTKASSVAEHVICADARLFALNREMVRVFNEQLARLAADERKALTEDQRQWLRASAPSCALSPSVKMDAARLKAARRCIAELYRDRIGVLKERCEIDEKRTVDDMAAQEKPWSTRLPKGFTVNGGPGIFVISEETGIAQSYNLPSQDLPAARVAGANLKTPYRFMALCRATGPDGTRWLASPMRDGSLYYVLESATRPARRPDSGA
jgi:uncharacterized protein